jgi:hypothetical protein
MGNKWRTSMLPSTAGECCNMGTNEKGDNMRVQRRKK